MIFGKKKDNPKQSLSENFETPEETSTNILQNEEIAELQDNKPATEPTPNIQMIPLRLVEPDPNQPRKNIDPQSEDIQELAESIKKNGLIHPITVREYRGKYIIVCGERRFTAHKVLKQEKILASIVSIDLQKCSIVQLQENLHRKNLTPFEEANSYFQLEELYRLPQKEIAELVHKDKGYISKMFTLRGISPCIRGEILSENISVSRRTLWELAKQPMDRQSVIWEKIKENPTEKLLLECVSEMAVETFSSPDNVATSKKPLKNVPEVDHVQLRSLLVNVLENHAEEFFAFFSPQKMQKFMKKFGAVEHVQPSQNNSNS